ncbi:hypothetical protein M0Q97_02190 [Candidatus Dojkabacteria bacterium]|jgi:hypothetical protein|nr:hypothetical protein [Candidatus Dojkabacteria bacterium]
MSEDLLKKAFLQSSINVDNETKIAVKAEDIENEPGIDFSAHFFEPEIGSTYLIKFLPNPGGELITHRSVYKKLPDPERKGKTFHYVSSGNAKTCKALELFFELHELKKNNDAIAKAKIDKYLSRTNQACCKIQILNSPKKEEIGIIRLFAFSTFGPNATVANLIDGKLNPSKEKIAQGEEREDIFNIFESPVLSLECIEANYDGVKGRDYTKSSWLKKNRGAFVSMDDGKIYEFSSKDVVDGDIIPEALPAFQKFVELVTHPDYDVYNYFAYKIPGDERNTKETDDYLKSVFAKVDEIIPIIKNKTLAEIANYGKKESNDDNSSKKSDVYVDSVPEELKNSVMNETKTESKTETKTETKQKSESNNDVDDIVNSVMGEENK